MLDLLGIMFSSIMMLIVIWRAARRDNQSPWFEIPPDPNAPPTGLARAQASAARNVPTWRKSNK